MTLPDSVAITCSVQHKKIISAHAHSVGGVIGDGEHAGKESIHHLRETVMPAGFCVLISFVRCL